MKTKNQTRKFRIVKRIDDNRQRVFNVQEYYTETFTKMCGFKKYQRTDWHDIEVDCGDVDFCIMVPKPFKTKKKAKQWIKKQK